MAGRMTRAASLRSRLHMGHVLVPGLVLLVLWAGFRAIAAWMAPLPDAPRFKAPFIVERQQLVVTDPFFGNSAGGESLPVTALPFSLHGVRTDQATGRGAAIIATGEGEQKVYLSGDTVSEDVMLAAVAVDHVILEHGGARETLWLDSGGDGQVQRHDPRADGVMTLPADGEMITGSDVPDLPPPPDHPVD